jgi:hypothetical protein
LRAFTFKDSKPIDRELLQRMTDVIRYRGPDAEGIYIKSNIGLGHRRLSIIDLSEAGKQPMFSDDKQLRLSLMEKFIIFRITEANCSSANIAFTPRQIPKSFSICTTSMAKIACNIYGGCSHLPCGMSKNSNYSGDQSRWHTLAYTLDVRIAG